MLWQQALWKHQVDDINTGMNLRDGVGATVLERRLGGFNWSGVVGALGDVHLHSPWSQGSYMVLE